MTCAWPLRRRLCAGGFAVQPGPVRVPRPYAKAFLDWDTIALDMVGALRTQAGRDPSDRGLSDLIGELATAVTVSPCGGRGDVRLHRTARKRLGNRVVGEIELTGDALDLAGDGLTMIAYSPRRAARPRTS